MENSMQNANEKMVPIDTSGDPVEIELKDEKEKVEVQEEPEKEIEVQEEQEPIKQEEPVDEKEKVSREKEKEEIPTDPYETGDLDNYSKGVKKRINNLVGRMREMERLYEATQKENEDLKKRYSSVGKGYVSEFEGRVTSSVEAAKSKLKKAIEDNDTEGQVTAQEQLAQAKADAVRLSNLKANQKRDEENAKLAQQQLQQQQQEPYQPVDPKAEEWASKNPWFGQDRAMTAAAMSQHEQLLQEGFDPTSNEYYTEINSYIRSEFPHKFEKPKEEKKTETKQPVQTVASAVRKTKSGRRVVKLTPSQVAIAKRLNVPLEEYAKHVKEA